MTRKELEDRLIDFCVNVFLLVPEINNLCKNNPLLDQLMRSSSAALNYAEAQAGESQRDFIHKMMISLKELRETQVCLKILLGLHRQVSEIGNLINENDELIRIIFASVRTSKSKLIISKPSK